MEWVNGSDRAFAKNWSDALLGATGSYLVFSTVIYAVGLVLVRAGQLLRRRRRAAVVPLGAFQPD